MLNRIDSFLPANIFADPLEQLVRLFEHAHVGLLVTDAEAVIREVNATVCTMTGYSREQLIGQKPSLFKSGQHEQRFYQQMWARLTELGFWQGEICNRRQDGVLYHELLSIAAVRDAAGRIANFVAILSDDTRRKADEELMRQVAHFDALTGLPNRLLLGDRLEQAITASRRAHTLLAVCFIDLDGFKHINDTLGHAAGDVMLREVARRLLITMRSSDTVARLGGDEFVVLIAGLSNADECCQTLERLLRAIAEPYALVADTISRISASIGVTIFPADDANADTLLRHADHAMYAAKHSGRNCYQLFDANMEQRMQARQDTLRRVERALQCEQFELYYQPIVNLRQGKVISAEALIRWNHPVLGRLAPSEFIPLLEDDELALRLGEWVLGAALRQNRAWHEQGIDLCISVNIFPRQLQRPNFAEVVARSIEQNWPGMPNGRLQLEIVETTSLKELEAIQNAILACRKLGVNFSLDDFGTGASSLNCLRLLGVDEIKIYQDFVRNMLDDTGALSIIKGVIGLGEAFGLRIVAEGVESAAHVRHLLELGCDVMQGFGIEHPLPAGQLPQWLANYSSDTTRSTA